MGQTTQPREGQTRRTPALPTSPGHSQPLPEHGAKSGLKGPPLAQSARTHSDGKKELGDRQTDSREGQTALRFSAHIGVTETTRSAWTPLFPASQSLGLAIEGILDSFKGSRPRYWPLGARVSSRENQAVSARRPSARQSDLYAGCPRPRGDSGTAAAHLPLPSLRSA